MASENLFIIDLDRPGGPGGYILVSKSPVQGVDFEFVESADSIDEAQRLRNVRMGLKKK